MPSPRTARATGPNLRERFDAMRNLAPFLRQIWQTSRTLTVASLGLRVVRALMPVVTLYIGKLIIDEAIRLIGLGVAHELAEAWHSGAMDHLLGLLGLDPAIAGVSAAAPIAITATSTASATGSPTSIASRSIPAAQPTAGVAGPPSASSRPS